MLANKKNNNSKYFSWNPTYHELLDSIIHKLLCPFPPVLIPHVSFNKKNSINLGLHPSIIACKSKLLLIKHFYIIHIFLKKNLIIHFACETNEIDLSMCIVMENIFDLVFCTKLWPTQETLRSHVLDISISYTLRDVRMSKIPQHIHVFLTWKTLIFCLFLWFFLGLVWEIT